MKFILTTTHSYCADKVCDEYPYLLVYEGVVRCKHKYTKDYRYPTDEEQDEMDVLLVEGTAEHIMCVIKELSELFQQPLIILDFSTNNYLKHPIIEIYNDYRE